IVGLKPGGEDSSQEAIVDSDSVSMARDTERGRPSALPSEQSTTTASGRTEDGCPEAGLRRTGMSRPARGSRHAARRGGAQTGYQCGDATENTATPKRQRGREEYSSPTLMEQSKAPESFEMDLRRIVTTTIRASASPTSESRTIRTEGFTVA